MRLTNENCHQWIGKMVRVSADAGRGGRYQQHQVPARLLEVRKNRALIAPRGHKRTEWVLLRHVHTWITGNQQCQRGSIN